MAQKLLLGFVSFICVTVWGTFAYQLFFSEDDPLKYSFKASTVFENERTLIDLSTKEETFNERGRLPQKEDETDTDTEEKIETITERPKVYGLDYGDEGISIDDLLSIYGIRSR